MPRRSFRLCLLALGARQDRAEVESVLEAKLDAWMKTYGLWSDWEAGKRGREK